jgi:hypothetical protein
MKISKRIGYLLKNERTKVLTVLTASLLDYYTFGIYTYSYFKEEELQSPEINLFRDTLLCLNSLTCM